MAYPAMTSLKQTLHRLRNSPYNSFLSISTPEIIEFATTLQQVLERSNHHECSTNSRKRLNDVDAEIKQTVHELEDILELHMSDCFLSRSAESKGGENSMESIDSLMGTMKTMQAEYVYEKTHCQDDNNNAAVITSFTDFDVKVVGLSNEFNHIKSKLLKSIRPDEFGVFSFVGVAGSSRSMIAKATYQLIYHEQSFDCGAMVTIGPIYQLKEITVSILAQTNDADELNISDGDDEKLLGEHLHSSLMSRKYIILIDDVSETYVWDELRRLFPDQSNGSIILITTSHEDVALYADCCRIFQVPVLDEDRTWDLFRAAIFGPNSSCPLELQESGKLIAKNIEGRIHSLAKAVLFLLKAEDMVACWNEVAADEEHSIFVVADELSEVNKILEDLHLVYSFWGDSPALRMVGAILNSGLSLNSLEQYRCHMLPDYAMPKIEFMSVLGMAGIGKTTLAKEIFKDQSILDRFDSRAWVTLGPRYQSEEILSDVLAQIYPDNDKISVKRDGALAEQLCAKLSNKRCLIVLDDMWNDEALEILENSLKKKKVKVLVTTRLLSVARFRPIYEVIVRMRLLNKEDSWSLLRQTVFPDGSCPFALLRPG